MTLDKLKEHWELAAIRQLPDGCIIGVSRMLVTHALLVNIDEEMYERRYCYKFKSDAIEAMESWNGKGAPPGPWIKEKLSDLSGPGAQ